MKIPPDPPNDQGNRMKELSFDDDAQAWEPWTEDLWIPYRIRGSWRGGVLG
jgi:hypothetical protein